MSNQFSPQRWEISKPIGIFIIVLCALLVGGILAWQYWWVPKGEVKMPGTELPEEVTQPEEELPKEIIPEDETADWQVYRNEKYGFEIKYPEDWYAYSYSEFGYDKVVFTNISEEEYRAIGIEKRPLEKEIYTIQIGIKEDSLEDWLKTAETHFEKVGGHFFKEQISIGDYKGYRIGNITEEGKGWRAKVLSNKGNVYIIEIIFPDRCRVEECKVFNQMLSTFRFLE